MMSIKSFSLSLALSILVDVILFLSVVGVAFKVGVLDVVVLPVVPVPVDGFIVAFLVIPFERETLEVVFIRFWLVAEPVGTFARTMVMSLYAWTGICKL